MEERITLGKKKREELPEKRKFSRRTVLSFFIVLIAIPFSIWFGWRY